MSYLDYTTVKSNTEKATIPVQKGFWQDQYIGATRQKLEELNRYHPEFLQSEKSSILAYWSEFEHLQDILGENWKDFENWFLKKATSPETITRCRRAMKENGTIKLTSEESEERQEQSQLWSEYWRNNKRINGVKIG